MRDIRLLMLSIAIVNPTQKLSRARYSKLSLKSARSQKITRTIRLRCVSLRVFISCNVGLTTEQVNLARAARTDAGVHAAGNVVSIKAIVEIPGVDDLVRSLNEALPPQIRVWSVVSVFARCGSGLILTFGSGS